MVRFSRPAKAGRHSENHLMCKNWLTDVAVRRSAGRKSKYTREAEIIGQVKYIRAGQTITKVGKFDQEKEVEHPQAPNLNANGRR